MRCFYEFAEFFGHLLLPEFTGSNTMLINHYFITKDYRWRDGMFLNNDSFAIKLSFFHVKN